MVTVTFSHKLFDSQRNYTVVQLTKTFTCRLPLGMSTDHQIADFISKYGMIGVDNIKEHTHEES